MNRKYIVCNLMGGLGNQLFQYSAGRALALRSGYCLALDSVTGFRTDRIYRREFELGEFPIVWEPAGWSSQFVSLAERVFQKLTKRSARVIENRPWGTIIRDENPESITELSNYVAMNITYMQGHFQSEDYFINCRSEIGRELTPPTPLNSRYLRMGELLRNENSVAVGMRLFEEVPLNNGGNVPNVTPRNFYLDATRRFAEQIKKPIFYVFCTKRFEELKTLELPGETRFITGDEGYENPVETMWLLSQSRNFVVSHSSFFWWGAWLSEFQFDNVRVIASNSFPRPSTIPARWEVI